MNFGDSRLPQRFWDKVSPCPMSGCWIWTGAVHPFGYGRFRASTAVEATAHRFAYEAFVGEIKAPALDHLCRTPACCNPAHLEPVTHRENALRGVGPAALNAAKTHCVHGHELIGDNVIVEATRFGTTNRRCRACHYRRNHDRYHTKHSAAARGA